jgi:outer membrane immunogenic protein
MWRLAGIVLLATTANAVSVSAFAADLPARTEPVAPIAYVQAFSWTGFYLGGELGWIQTNPRYTTGALLLGTPFLVTSGSDKNGLTYGVLAGYNYQVGQLVLGVESDFQGWTVGQIRYTASPEISSRRAANGAARSAGASATLLITPCSI